MPKLLPPFIFLILLAALTLLSLIHPQTLGQVHQSGVPLVEVAFIVAVGLIFLIGARIQFNRNDSEIMTFDQPRNLVTDGLFRMSRNPMYLGFTLLLVAASLMVNLWCALLAPAAFFLLANYWYIPFEEAASKDIFGDDYEQYQNHTRRWL